MDTDMNAVECNAAVITAATAAVLLGRSGPHLGYARHLLEEAREEGFWVTEQLEVNGPVIAQP